MHRQRENGRPYQFGRGGPIRFGGILFFTELVVEVSEDVATSNRENSPQHGVLPERAEPKFAYLDHKGAQIRRLALAESCVQRLEHFGSGQTAAEGVDNRRCRGGMSRPR